MSRLFRPSVKSGRFVAILDSGSWALSKSAKKTAERWRGSHVWGLLNRWEELINEHAIEEVILAVRSSEHGELESIINRLEGTGVGIKIIPDIYDILSGMVRMQSLFGAPLIAIRKEIMPAWQVAVKRAMDVVISSVALLLLTPLLLAIAVAVKLSSKGPVFFHQERVGRWGAAIYDPQIPVDVCRAQSATVRSCRAITIRASHVVGRFLRKSRLGRTAAVFQCADRRDVPW